MSLHCATLASVRNKIRLISPSPMRSGNFEPVSFQSFVFEFSCKAFLFLHACGGVRKYWYTTILQYSMVSYFKHNDNILSVKIDLKSGYLFYIVYNWPLFDSWGLVHRFLQTHVIYVACPFWGCAELSWARSGYTLDLLPANHRSDTYRHPFTHSNTYGQFRVPS